MTRSGLIIALLGIVCARAACADVFDDLDRKLTFATDDGHIVTDLSLMADATLYVQDAPAQGLLFTDNDALVAPRIAMFLDSSIGERVLVHVQLDADTGSDPNQENRDLRFDEYFVEAQLTDVDHGRLTLRAGKFATVFGSWIGANIAFGLPRGALQVIYGIFLIYCAWRFIEPRKWLAARRAGTTVVTASEAERRAPWYGLMFVGVCAGVASGLFGIGGGAVIVPVLFEVFRILGVPEAIRMQLCIGTSLAIIIPTAIRSYREHQRRGLVLADVMRRWTLPSMAGVAVGSALAAVAPPDVFQAAFVLIAGLIAAKLLIGRDGWNLGSELPGGVGERRCGERPGEQGKSKQ